MSGFIVYALPRSRTAWLARFLTYGPWVCGHEQLHYVRSLDDVTDWFKQPCAGTAETAGAPWWRTVRRMAPGLRTLVVRRPVDDVIRSLVAKSPALDEALLWRSVPRLDGKLNQIAARVPDAMVVNFEELALEATCARIFEHCLGIQHDPEWYAAVSAVNIQVNLNQLLRYYVAHAGQLERLGRVVKQRELAAITNRPVKMEGMTFQQERFDDFLRDGERLFQEHLSQVGEPPENLAGKNIALMRTLDDMGLLQVTTARSNGRMFGYLMAVISPSLESPSLTSAVHTTFFASPMVRGLGLKLQSASVEALRARGIGEVLLRAGTRGDGPRMSVLYKRMGAEFCGSDYLLPLTVH